MDLESILSFYYGLPGYGKAIIIILGIIIIFSLLKRFLKFAILMAILTILIIFIFRLLE